MRKLIKLALAALMVCSLFACSSNSSSEPENSGDDSQGNVSTEGTTITIWHTFTEGQEVELQRLAGLFEEETGVKVVCQSQPYANFESLVYDSISNGVGPDFIFNYASLAIDYDAYGKSLNFSKYWDADFDYSKLVSEGIYHEGTDGFADGGVHAVAVQTTGPVYFYNATWLEELNLEEPKTWDDVWNVSKAIYEAKGVPGFAVDSLNDFLQILILQCNDQKYVDLENKEVLWNTEEVKKWVQWFKDGVLAGYFQILPTTGDYNSGDICANQLGAYIGSSAGIPYLTLPEGQELGVAPVPQIDLDNPVVVGWNRSVIGFTSDDEAKNKAVSDFAAFMTRAENDAAWVVALSAYSPYFATQELADYQAYVAENLALVALGKQINYSVVLPNFGNASTVRDELKTLITSAASDANSDVDALFDAAVARCNAAIKEAN